MNIHTSGEERDGSDVRSAALLKSGVETREQSLFVSRQVVGCLGSDRH